VALLVISAQMLCLTWRRELAGLMSYFGPRELKRLASGVAVAAGLVGLVWWASGGRLGPPRSVIIIDAVVAFGVVAGARVLLKTLRDRRSLRGPEQRPGHTPLRVGIVGAGELGAWLATQLNLKRNGRCVEVLFDDDPQKWNKWLHGVPIAGMPECVLDGSWAHKLDEVIVAMPDATKERIAQVNEVLSRAKIPARTIPSLEEILS
jgi:FlaA1/EpsC-like NDP-sugar epimerase